MARKTFLNSGANGVASLTVHRNTKARRERQVVQRNLLSRIRHMATSSDCRAFAVVIFDANGVARSIWDTGRIIPLWALPDTIAHILKSDIANEDITDDHIPPEDRRG